MSENVENFDDEMLLTGTVWKVMDRGMPADVVKDIIQQAVDTWTNNPPEKS